LLNNILAEWRNKSGSCTIDILVIGLSVSGAVIFKIFFTRKYIKIIFFIFKKLFLTSAHQNDLKTLKKY
jgi:hypothetical protein